jgi:hypothetical protein
VLLLSACLVGQDAEHHLTDSLSGSLCRHSAYVHGYIHGYENGFRMGDLEFHLGREPRAVNLLKEYRHVAGYRREFGDSGSFRRGYQHGFRAAYEDALRGTSFRGIDQIRHAAQGASLTADSKEFDQAASAGYDAGFAAGQQDSTPPSAVQQTSEACPASGNDNGYCEGFSRGFQLGYSDGSVSQSSELTRTARAGVTGSQ